MRYINLHFTYLLISTRLGLQHARQRAAPHVAVRRFALRCVAWRRIQCERSLTAVTRPTRTVEMLLTIAAPVNMLIPRLHDTTGLTTGLTTVLNEQPLFVQPVVKPGCATQFDIRLNVCIHDTTGCLTGLTTGLTTGCIV